MKEEAAYVKHNWDSDEKWKQHVGKVIPAPEGETLECMKRQWLKINMEMNFDLDTTSTEEKLKSA